MYVISSALYCVFFLPITLGKNIVGSIFGAGEKAES